ncbi:hypothetical protein C6380_12830 [Pseudomonas syringae pv. actinidiae]|uniref:hypothetical protein n=1 Tax=Pseudomonas syringae TaxID=317 RepID=UPI000BB5645A|nr:hypothetical protein [Pseudomonas syringae]PBK49098.1 hypothetical protein BUE61_24010 [Pseudomonas syringae pv. actinidiae]PBK49137.1 hypothetical protein BUE60_25115 [Pseudomonas syringae pv. actinidiae]RJX55231.1 hypothetical protein C6383_24780 [Pseudomonas syringae pv. actinidiae]RJX56384.1 hypothetical protein C6380_12830 [Pseudomonas syringae pv. actinidiae]RJX60634.1 hypothetical protein C6379_05865 [Pseudomonas syringae pv. actinidiae]
MADDLEYQYLPLGGTDVIDAVIAVRGKDYPLKLLGEHFQLRPSAQIVNGEEGYLLIIEDFDRYENPKLGQLQAIEVTSAESCRRLCEEMKSWRLEDFQSIDTSRGAKALVKLGLIKRENLQHCSSAIRDAYISQDLGL